ncbi:MAG TPA: Ig-like domain-containing protein, partial [Bryobacteraceae bacterium]
SKASIAKALWVIDGHDVAIDNFEFRNAGTSTSATNAEAIRIEPGTTTSPNGGNVTVERSYIHDNFEGILSDGIASGAAWYSATPYITFQYDEFADNGYGDGLTHNIYIGCCGNMNFTLQYSWSHDSYVGHAVKDRAPISNILYNLIGDSAGNTSYLLDFPLGGSTYVVGNSLYKLATTNRSANAAAVIFADVSDNGAGDPEYGTANQDLHFINNTMVLDPANGNSSASPAFVSLGCLQAAYSDCALPPNGPALTVPAVVENNIFLGAETEATNQAGAFVENNLLESNAVPSELAALKFNNAAAFDFRLTAGSPAIGAGVYPPTNNAGAADPKALAAYQYVHPENKAVWPTPSGATMDAGAFPAQTITAPSLNLSYTETVQAPNSGVITVTGLPTPAPGQYNYASFVSMNQAAIPSIESVASSTGTVTTTFNTAAVTTATVVPIYVYVEGTVLTANVTVTPATLPAASIAIVSGSGQTAAVGSNFANPLVVVVKDAGSNPVSGATVTFAGTGVSFPSGATATTNSSGQAQITAQPTVTGALTVTATVAGVSTPASFSETGTAGVAGSVMVVSGSGQTAAVGSNFTNPLVVVVKDASSNPVSGATVTFAGTGISFPSGATATTNGSGQAQITAQPTVTGALTVTATVAGAASPAIFSEAGTAMPNFTLAANPTTLSIPHGQYGTVTLNVTPMGGFNQAVSFSCSGLPTNSTCSFSPSNVTLDGATVSASAMTIATTQTTSRNDGVPPSSPKSGRWPFAGGGITLALGLFFLGKRKRLPTLFCAVLFLGMGGITIGCGMGSPYANSGTSTVVVTATSGSGASAITQTVTISISIQ